MIPKIIHRVWLGDAPIPAASVVYWQRFAQLYPGWELRTWTDTDVPGHVTGDLLKRCPNYGAAGDIARGEILLVLVMRSAGIRSATARMFSRNHLIASASGAAPIMQLAAPSSCFTAQQSIHSSQGGSLRRGSTSMSTAALIERWHDGAGLLDAVPFVPDYIVDVGAHIGAFTAAAHQRWPAARFACVEPMADNVRMLALNVGFAKLLHAACFYGDAAGLEIDDPIATGRNTACATLVHAGRPMRDTPAAEAARCQRRPLDVPAVTLEQIRERCGFPRIDLLKLDCEGAEENILACADLSGVRAIVGEFHHRARFIRIIQERFGSSGWSFKELHPGETGEFCMLNQAI